MVKKRSHFMPFGEDEKIISFLTIILHGFGIIVKRIPKSRNEIIMRGIKKQIRISFGLIFLFFSLILLSTNGILWSQTKLCYIQITDTHISENPETHQILETVLADVEQLPNKPAFVINTGDITEFGSEIEFKHYETIMDKSGLTFYNAPGNHDVRWSNIGKKRFVKRLGPLYHSFDISGIHVFMLDSGLLLEQYGHFSQQQLIWLQQELIKIGTEKPIILAAHHPIFLEKKYVDNEFELLELLEGYNIILFLCGHGHRNQHWQINGIHFLMTKAVKSDSPGYRIFETDGDSIWINLRNLTDKASTLDFSSSLKRDKSEPKFTIDLPESKKFYIKNIPISIHSKHASQIDVSLDGINWETLKPDRDKFNHKLDIKNFSEGNYYLTIKFVTTQGKLWLYRFPVQIGCKQKKLGSSFMTKDAILASPAIIDNLVLVGSLDSNLYALEAENMDLLWSFKTSGPIVTSPAIHEDTIFVPSGDGFCYALKKATGSLIWKARGGEAIFSSPIYVNGKIIMGSSDSSLHALRSADGNSLWKFKTNDYIKARPAFYDDKVFVGSWDRYFYCVSADDGNLIWKQKISDNRYFPAATSNPLIFNNKIIVSSHDHVVHAFNAQIGKLLWQHQTNNRNKPGYSSPVSSDNKIYFGSLSGHLFALDAQSGREVWSVALPDSMNPDPIFDSSPAIAGSQIMVGSISGVVYGANKDAGKPDWTFKLSDGYIFSSPIVWKNYVFMGSCDGKIYKLLIMNEP